MDGTEEAVDGIEEAAEELVDLSVQLLSQILASNPKSSIKFLKVKEGIYAYWRILRQVQDRLKNTDWKKKMGRVRDQGKCDACWAHVAAELVSALLFILKKNEEYIEYSAQDLLDFANPEKAQNSNKKDHYCYTWTIRRGLLYIVRQGIQKESARPYTRCRHASEIPERTSSDLGLIDGVESLSFDQALIKLETQPIGAALHIFLPDYALAKEQIYRGPMCKRSAFRGMHAVSVIGVGEENGEKYFMVKSTHGTTIRKDGYLKVSMEAMLVKLAEDKDYKVPQTDTVLGKSLLVPTPLITDFRCPTIHKKPKGSPMKCDSG